ncbi:unnamed protein product [Linum trigynum]|uniref:Uncharacterized protein n=1 Tax=Linum trigynum TaxID=586398 RepID=A0AAV2G8R7_9ROSI
MIAKKPGRQIYEEEEPSHAFDGAPKSVWINKAVREVSGEHRVGAGNAPSQREIKMDQERPKFDRRMEREQGGKAAHLPAANNKSSMRNSPRGFSVAKSPRMRAGKGNRQELQPKSTRQGNGDMGRTRAAETLTGKQTRPGLRKAE